MNTKRNRRIVGAVMMIIAAVFVIFALSHPEISFPWDNTVTYVIYDIYLVIMTLLFIAPVHSTNA